MGAIMGCGCSCVVQQRRHSVSNDELTEDADLPAVAPPTKRKEAVYNQELFKDIDKHAAKVHIHLVAVRASETQYTGMFIIF